MQHLLEILKHCWLILSFLGDSSVSISPLFPLLFFSFPISALPFIPFFAPLLTSPLFLYQYPLFFWLTMCLIIFNIGQYCGYKSEELIRLVRHSLQQSSYLNNKLNLKFLVSQQITKSCVELGRTKFFIYWEYGFSK